jgi:hypothetical protein
VLKPGITRTTAGRDDALSEAVKRLFRKIEKRTFANGNYSVVTTAELPEPKFMKPISLLAIVFALGSGMGYAAAADIPKCSDPFVIQIMQKAYVEEMQQALSDAQDGRVPGTWLLLAMSHPRPQGTPSQDLTDFKEYIAAIRRGDIPLPSYVVTSDKDGIGVRYCKAVSVSDPGANGQFVVTDVRFTVTSEENGMVYVKDIGEPSAVGGALVAAAKRQLGH